MSNLALIEAQRLDFDTTQTHDWLDGLPAIGTPSFGGALPGALNVGNGELDGIAVGRGAVSGAHVVEVTAVRGGLTRFTVSDPFGTLTGSGVVGLPVSAGGIAFTLNPGATPFAVGDSFAVAVVSAPLDITGLRFDLDARAAVGAASIALQASSAGDVPTIATGGVSGTIAMLVLRARMAKLAVKAEGYPYALSATDPVTGLTVPVFYGLIHHTANATQIGQGG